jgi:hypothetical protein
LKRLFIASAVAVLLSGCAIAAKVSARHEMETSKAAYKACLAQNGRDLDACEGLRQTYEADLAAYRTTSAAARPAPVYSNEGPVPAPNLGAPAIGQEVFSFNECVGPIVMGVCHGAILPHSAYHPTCYGQMLNGICTGPMF